MEAALELGFLRLAVREQGRLPGKGEGLGFEGFRVQGLRVYRIRVKGVGLGFASFLFFAPFLRLHEDGLQAEGCRV